MHLRNKLSVKKVGNLTEAGVYSDGGGLYLRVRKAGTRSWLYICMVAGRRREIGLGSVYDVSLGEARAKASDLRRIFLAGLDPFEERKKAAIAAKPKMTFGEMAESLMDDIEDGFRNQKHRNQWRSSIRRYAESILAKPVDAVTTDDILELLKPIWLTKRETASRVRQRIERVLDAAGVKGLRSGDNPARWRGNLEFLLPRQNKIAIKHHKALPFDQLSHFMPKLRGRSATTARALEFTILTAARTGEILGMTWGEVDFEKKLWTIPGERMKAGVTHEVPLCEAALLLLGTIKPKNVGFDEIVFKGPKGGPMSNMAMAQLLKRMDCDATVHGFRSTFRDWAGEETSFAREDIEMALAHTIQSHTERAYRRGNALEKRRDVMESWSGFCNNP